MDQYRVTERTGWGKRIGGALGGVVIGLLLFIISFPLLWWNEGRAVDRAETLEQGLEAVVPIDAGRIAPSKDGLLVHISGPARSDGTLSDPMFGIDVDALVLRRAVEMYQWVEQKQERTVTESGGSERTETTYTYSKAWSEQVQDSSGFQFSEGHENPGFMPFDERLIEADRISIEAFTLGRDFVDQLDEFETFPVTETMATRAAPDIRSDYRVLGGRFQRGDPAAPEIGDVRIGFEIVRPQEISAVGAQIGDRLEVHPMKRGEIALLEFGRASAHSMFKAAETENLILTWALRLAGFTVMWIGLSLLLWPAKVLADVLPFLGHLVGGGVSMITGLSAIGLSALTIGMAWIAARPLLGIGLLVVVAAAGIGAAFLIKRRANASETSSAKLAAGP